MENNTTAIRIFFSKTGRAKYISALDLINCFQRALRRTDIPVWHTQGFNPHTYVNVNLPLSLGTEGIRESMDIKLTTEMSFSDVKDKLNAVLPRDIRVTEVALPVKKHTAIEKSVYQISIKCNMDKFKEFCNLPAIEVEKKTKRGVSTVDLKPHIKVENISDEGFVLYLPSGCDFTVNPSLLFDAYEKYSGEEIEKIDIVRSKILCKDGSEFI
ncbi:MAG: DUF2344 domain-containing protein [Ruminiclostridium sp.]|nr:DUF2344 domain-containing protein [Ruminiclostridium sp.]